VAERPGGDQDRDAGRGGPHGEDRRPANRRAERPDATGPVAARSARSRSRSPDRPAANLPVEAVAVSKVITVPGSTRARLESGTERVKDLARRRHQPRHHRHAQPPDAADHEVDLSPPERAHPVGGTGVIRSPGSSEITSE
jgi:hypothetical protein